MSIQKNIEAKLISEFAPAYLSVLNESHMHSVPINSETHFRVEIVSEKFKGLNRVARSRKVYDLLAHELSNGVHALSLKLFAPEEWDGDAGEASPACHSGSKT